MAISSSLSATISCCSAPPFKTTLSSFSSLRPHRPRHLPFANTLSLSPRRARILPVVQAKQQTFTSFDELVVNSDKPVLVDFYATWCGPCQFMVPILEQVSATLKDKIQVVKIDTEKYPNLADKYKIEALPTFILFKGGEPFDRFEGALPADKLVQRIEESLAVKS